MEQFVVRTASRRRTIADLKGAKCCRRRARQSQHGQGHSGQERLKDGDYTIDQLDMGQQSMP